MRTSTIFFFLATFLLLYVWTCAAQGKPIISNDPPAPAAVYPLVKQVGQAKVFYNAKKDETISRTKSVQVFGQPMDGLSLAAEFISKGKNVVEPKQVTLKIYFMGKDRIFIDNRTIKIFVDNKKLIAGTTKFVSANESNVIFAQLEKTVSYRDFVTISKSGNVRMQIGPASFGLTTAAVQRLSDLIGTIEK